MAKCKNCEAELPEHCDYEDSTVGPDEDKGWVEDIYEVTKCRECGYDNRVHIGDRPSGSVW